jgi:hypothetical protein
MDQIPFGLYSMINDELHEAIVDPPKELTRNYLDECCPGVTGSSANPIILLLIPAPIYLVYGPHVFKGESHIYVCGKYFIGTQIYASIEGIDVHVATVEQGEILPWKCKHITTRDPYSPQHMYHNVTFKITVMENIHLITFSFNPKLLYESYYNLDGHQHILNTTADYAVFDKDADNNIVNINAYCKALEPLIRLPTFMETGLKPDILTKLEMQYLGFMIANPRVTSPYLKMSILISKYHDLRTSVKTHQDLLTSSLEANDEIAAQIQLSYLNVLSVDILCKICTKQWWNLLLNMLTRITQPDRVSLMDSLILCHPYVFRDIPESVIWIFYNWRNRITTERLRILLRHYGRVRMSHEITSRTFKQTILRNKEIEH